MFGRRRTDEQILREMRAMNRRPARALGCFFLTSFALFAFVIWAIYKYLTAV